MEERVVPDEVLKMIARRRRWALYRHVHLLAAFDEARARMSVGSVLSVGCGAGLSELYLAVREPSLRVVLADYDPSRIDRARSLAKNWSIPNVEFEQIDLLAELADQQASFDFVMAIEVLEHIENDTQAAANLFALSRAFTYVLVPYASRREQADERLQKRVWDRHEHFRVGYDGEQIQSLCPMDHAVLFRRNCYMPAAAAHRQEMEVATDDSLVERRWSHVRSAALDVRDDLVAGGMVESQGIEMLTRKG